MSHSKVREQGFKLRSPAHCATLQNSLAMEHMGPLLKLTLSALPGYLRRSVYVGAGENCAYVHRLEPAGLRYLATAPSAHLWKCYHQAGMGRRGGSPQRPEEVRASGLDSGSWPLGSLQ